MVEVAELAVEDVRVRVLALELRAQVGVAGGHQCPDRVLLVVRVQVADDELATRLGSVGPVASQSTIASAALVRTSLQLPWPSPASGSSAQADPFDLRWFTATVTSPPVSMSANVCERGPVARRPARVDRLVENGELSDRRHPAGW